MPKALFKFGNLIRGFGVLPPWGSGTATVKQAVHDGDTVGIMPDGHFGVRFLGIDTPEKTFLHPKIKSAYDGKWVSVEKFEKYLHNPFLPDYPNNDEFIKNLTDDLKNHLEAKLNHETAKNHKTHADDATKGLEKIIQEDYDAKTALTEDFKFFMAFSYEIMDGLGRFLCYLDYDKSRDERDDKITYNEKMLREGHAEPYFIWPNTNPFSKESSIKDAAFGPDEFYTKIENDKRFSDARNFVQTARKKKKGIFNKTNKLTLSAFELRFLARRKPPSRYVIDLSKKTDTILSPTKYHTIKHQEDRLFVNYEHLPLFAATGWKIEGVEASLKKIE